MSPIRHGSYYGYLQHKMRRALGLPDGHPCGPCLGAAGATVTFLCDLTTGLPVAQPWTPGGQR